MAVGPQDEEKAAKHLDALEALGLIEFAPPPERVQLRIQVIDRLQQIMTEVGWTRGRTDAVGHLSLCGARCILEGLETAGFEVVRVGG